MSSLIRGDARQSRAFRYFPVHFSSSLNPQDIPDSTCVAASERYWTRTHLDVFGRPVEIITADGERSTLEYEGLTEIRTNPLGQRVETTRNVQGQKVTERRYPAPGEPGAAMRTDFKYDALGQLRITDGPLSGDAMARGSGLSFCMSSLIRGDARQSRAFRYFPVHFSSSLNPQDIPDSTCVAASERYWTRTHLDVFGRPVEIITADGERSTLEYEGLTEIRTNPLGQRVETTRNVQGQKVTELRYPAPGEPGAAMRTDFEYDALRRPGGQVFRFAYQV